MKWIFAAWLTICSIARSRSPKVAEHRLHAGDRGAGRRPAIPSSLIGVSITRFGTET
jgi:hypothetical protein